MGNGLDVRLHMHERFQLFIPLDHVPSRIKAVASDLHSGGEDRERRRLPPVQDDRSHHDAGRNR
ncbi:hypothetical protein D3C87_1688260 [compost metagenome]